jgi:hypothetical protein
MTGKETFARGSIGGSDRFYQFAVMGWRRLSTGAVAGKICGYHKLLNNFEQL